MQTFYYYRTDGGFMPVVPICRPIQNQTTVFSCHKRVHALYYQSIATNNGQVQSRQDSGMLSIFRTKRPPFTVTDLMYEISNDLVKRVFYMVD